MARIDSYLALGRQQGCSDIHFAVGLPPLVRIDGELTPSSHPPVEEEAVRSMLAELMDESHKQEFKKHGAVDISYAVSGLGRFRINVLSQRTGPAAVCRVIPNEIVPLEKLGLPAMVSSLADLPAGLVLVTGACGTGKSSTLAAIVDEINRRRKVTVMTLENPIEFLHESAEALVIQREVGVHCHSFAEGLRAALRQDPDVLVVTEMNDEETIRLALADVTGAEHDPAKLRRPGISSWGRCTRAAPPRRSTAFSMHFRRRRTGRCASPWRKTCGASCTRSWCGRRTAAGGARRSRSS